MSFFSRKHRALTIAAAVIAVASFASFEASAKPMGPGIPTPGVSPMPGKFNWPQMQPSGGCPGGLVGCTPNTYTPGKSGNNGNHWHGNGGNWGYGGGVAITLAQPALAVESDCYYVRRKVYIDGVGVVRKRELVCN